MGRTSDLSTSADSPSNASSSSRSGSATASAASSVQPPLKTESRLNRLCSGLSRRS